MKRCLPALGAALLLMPAAVTASGCRPAPPAKPNIILVMPDDTGYGAYSCLGNPVMKTPAVDAFWKESVRLTVHGVSPLKVT